MNEPIRPRSRLFSGPLLLMVLAVIVFGMVAAGYSFITRMMDATRDAYAGWNVAGLIQQHMDAHNGAWPRNWDDLHETHRTARPPLSSTFENLRTRCEVDFTADPAKLAAMPLPPNGSPPFKVVWLRNGKSTHWEGSEPNELLWAYLQTRSTTRPTTEPSLEK